MAVGAPPARAAEPTPPTLQRADGPTSPTRIRAVAVSTPGPDEAPIDRVLATIGGELITASDIGFWLWEQRLRNPRWRAIPAETLEPILLRRMIDEILATLWAADQLKEAPTEEIEKATDETLERLKTAAPSMANFDDWLAGEGFTAPEVRRRLRDREERLWFLRTAIASRLQIRPSQLDRSEITRLESGERPVRYRLRQILLRCNTEGRDGADDAYTPYRRRRGSATAPPGSPARADRDCSQTLVLALRVRRELLAGMPFSLAAELYSDDAATKRVGGELGWLAIQDINPTLEQVARQNLTGAVAPPVQTPGGIHLIEVVDFDTPSSLALMRRVQETYQAVVNQERGIRMVQLAEGVEVAPEGEVRHAPLEGADVPLE